MRKTQKTRKPVRLPLAVRKELDATAMVMAVAFIAMMEQK